MSSALTLHVPSFDGTNYQAWSTKIKAYLCSVDLWLIVNGTVTHPAAAGEAQAAWDNADQWGIGLIQLTMKDHVLCKVDLLVVAAEANAADHHCTMWWAQTLAKYGTILPSQVFNLIKQALNFHLYGSKHPCPQLDALESIYTELVTNGVVLPAFFKSMTLLAHLPPSLETSIIQTVMAGGNVLDVTWTLTRTTILRYWDAEQVKKAGHRNPSVHKLSVVKKYQGPPSFRSQAAPPAGGSSQGKKKKQGSAGKGKKTKYGKVHFVTTASGPAPVVHSIAHFTLQGMEQQLAVSDPVTSSFGQGPWPSFNNVMMMVDHLQVPRTQRTVQRLEQSLLEQIYNPPNPSSSSEEGETGTEAPPSLVLHPATPLEYMDKMPPSVASTPERCSPAPQERPTSAPPIDRAGNGGHPFSGFCRTPMVLGTNVPPRTYTEEDCISWGDSGSLFGDDEPGSVSGIYDLIQDDDWYVFNDSALSYTDMIAPKTACASKRNGTLSESDSVILHKYSSTCPGSHCTVCKGSGSNLRNPEWMLDSGASAHFTPVFSDFIAFSRFKEPLSMNTVSSPLTQYGFGTVLLQYLIYNPKGKEITKTLHIRDVIFVPHITQRILSLGDFLTQGMHVYGDMHMITLKLPECNTPVFQCGPLNSGEKLFWLRASSVNPTSLNLVLKEDYELMHRRFGHPSKDVMRRALQNTQGFPKIDFPRSKPICPGCTQGKMPQKAFLPLSPPDVDSSYCV